ncbi:hypothetical protein RJ639_005286 [Escallonia herrerae]|uniref:Uncharacterized protein n=1 Tax=Escallonia herrerae TaxID=1293975 RepID=A0AA88W641_9ASTE|nr:hypothetical protein RJ639_005286 [Escallonia herrerae]
MISGFLRCYKVEDASRLFEEMPRRNVISYTSMIDGGYVENERLDEARELFGFMPGRNVVAVTAMITGYCKEGKMDTARILFEEIQCRDCVSFNAMIAGYVQNENCEEALKLLVQMLGSGLKPDHSTLVSVLTACASLASLKEGRQIHAVLLKCGLDSHESICDNPKPNHFLGNHILYAHFTCDEAIRIPLKLMVKGKIGTWERDLELWTQIRTKTRAQAQSEALTCTITNVRVAGPKTRSGSFDFRQKQLSSVLSRTISASKLCRGDALGSQVDGDALISLEQKSFKVGSSSKNRKDKTSRMQQHIDQLQEELNRAMEQYRAAEDESARAREREAKMRMSQPFSPSKVEDVFEELKTLKELLSNSQRELGIKDKSIESLKVELEKAKQFELELAEREATLERLKEELTNAEASEARAIGLSSERNKRIQELEAEVERGKISESKMFDSVVCQSKQLEETKVELEQSKLEIASLHEELEKLQRSSSRHSEHLHSNKDAFESLRSELLLAKENLARAQEGEKLASLKAKSVVDEIGLLKNELKLATDAEEKSKKAMDDLALALKEVATASHQEKEKHNLTQAELEHVKSEAEQLKVMVRGIEDRYQKLLDEAKKETELHQNTADRLRLEAEETLLAWNGKEMGFVGCIRRAEEERALAQHENAKLAESLKAAENTTRVAREESYKLRDILKQALNEASVAKEAASIARDENSQLKDCLDEKDEALHFLTRENERLRINETAAQENIKELKRLLSTASSERTEEKEQEGMFKSPNSSPNSVFKEHLEDIKPNTPFRFDLNELKIQNEHGHLDETVEDEDPARAEALKGSIFDTPVSPTSEPQTPKSESTYHRRGSSSAETLNSEDFDHLDSTTYDDTDGDRTLHRRRRSALFRKFGDLITRKSFHKREPE